MTGILGKFYVDHANIGLRVMARSEQLTALCTSDAQIDENVQLLKDDLDACAKEMKRLFAIERRGSLFEGWPSAAEDAVNA